MKKDSQGFALITVMMFMAVAITMFATYSAITRTEVISLRASKDSFSGFNAGEAGLNIRADMIKNDFVNYNRPAGVSPANSEACSNSSTAGAGDFACQDFTMASKNVATTYVAEHPGNPSAIVIPQGEPFAGLTASEYRYTVTSVAKNVESSKEANLELMFKTRLVPLFQFLVFFDDDLELISGTGLHASGPIHSNRDIYHAMQAAWWIGDPHTYWKGPISSAGKQYRGLKSITSCHVPSGQGDDGYYYDIYVNDLATDRVIPGCPGGRYELQDSDLKPFNGNWMKGVPKLTVPDINTFNAFALPDPAAPNTFTYWQRSDLRFVLKLTAAGLPDTSVSPTGIEVVDSAGAVLSDATTKLNDPTQCTGGMVTGGGAGRSVGAKGDWASTAPYTADDQLRLFRDFTLFPAIDNFETVFDVDLANLLSCIHKFNGSFLGTRDIDETTDGGLVMFFAIDGPNSAANHNNYAVRFSDSALLQANTAGAPKPVGMTLVTDQKAVTWGDFNSVDAQWIPAAIISDSQYVLSDVWTDSLSTHTRDGAACGDGWGCSGWWNRFTNSHNLKIRAAILSGVQKACGANGVTCETYLQGSGGGYYAMFRFNETYYDGNNTGSTTYHQPDFDWKGSIVSVHAPNHNQTLMVGPVWYYSEPNFLWNFDTRFNDPDKLPPLTPRAVYNKQELFERNYN